MGREPFERVGACQTLARQTAPTALAPVYHLTASSPSCTSLSSFSNRSTSSGVRSRAGQRNQLWFSLTMSLERRDLADPKSAAKERRRRPAPRAGAIRGPWHRDRDVDDATHLPMRRDLDPLHRDVRCMLRRLGQHVEGVLELLVQRLASTSRGITAASIRGQRWSRVAARGARRGARAGWWNAARPFVLDVGADCSGNLA